MNILRELAEKFLIDCEYKENGVKNFIDKYPFPEVRYNTI